MHGVAGIGGRDMRRHLLLAAALLALVAGHVEASALEVRDAWTRAIGTETAVAVGYLTVRNPSHADDRLIAASSPSAEAVELHETVREGDVVHMRHRPDGLQVPAGGTLRLEPAGTHLMLLRPRGPFRVGERVSVTLTFERAGPVAVGLTVQAPGARAPRVDGHSGH